MEARKTQTHHALGVNREVIQELGEILQQMHDQADLPVTLNSEPRDQARQRYRLETARAVEAAAGRLESAGDDEAARRAEEEIVLCLSKYLVETESFAELSRQVSH